MHRDGDGVFLPQSHPRRKASLSHPGLESVGGRLLHSASSAAPGEKLCKYLRSAVWDGSGV